MGHHLVLKSGNQMDAINMYPWLYTFYYHDVMYHWHVPEYMLCNIFYYPYYVSFCKVEIPFSNYRWFVQSWRNLVGLSMVILCQKWGPVLLKWNRHEQDTWAIQDTLVDWLPKGLILPNLLGIMIPQSFRETVFNQLVFHEMGKRGTHLPEVYQFGVHVAGNFCFNGDVSLLYWCLNGPWIYSPVALTSIWRVSERKFCLWMIKTQSNFHHVSPWFQFWWLEPFNVFAQLYLSYIMVGWMVDDLLDEATLRV